MCTLSVCVQKYSRKGLTFEAMLRACLGDISLACSFLFNSNDFHFELGVGNANKFCAPTVVKRESQDAGSP